ncbi:DsbA family protein [Patescibacteria group bacterium]
MYQKEAGLQLSSKASFLLGLLGGVLALCTIGFFVLLGIMLTSDATACEAETAQPAAKAPAAAPPTAPDPDEGGVGAIKPVSDSDHVTGPSDPDLTMIVYTDIECPFCSRFHPSMEQVQEELGDRVQVVMRHFPLSFHANAKSAANAAECAGEQDMFFEYVHELFANNTRLGNDLYEEIAEDLGLSMGKFSDCVDTDKYAAKINADFQSGVAAGVQGTPGSLLIPKVGEPEIIPGAVPADQLIGIIESMM